MARHVGDPVDMMAPWTIKSVSTRARNGFNTLARKEGLTVGQFLDKVYDALESGAGGVPVVSEASAGTDGAQSPANALVAIPAPASRPTKLDRITGIAAAVAALGQAGVPVDPEHARRLTEALVDALPARKGAASEGG